MKDISRQYDMLNADERFRLFMDAASRVDYQELDRLSGSCPRKTYRMDDAEYTGKKMWFFLMTLYQTRTIAKLEAIALAGLVLMLAHEGDEDDMAEIKPVLSIALERRERSAEAWKRFCEQIGVEPDALRPQFGPDSDDFWPLFEACIRSVGIDPKPDEQQVQRSLAPLSELWRERFGSGP